MINDANSIANLYGNTVDNDMLAKIQDFAKDGFTEEELFELEEQGVDISLLKADKAEDNKEAGNTNAAQAGDVTAKVEELKAKYSKAAGGGDPYSMSNPQMEAFKEAMSDGIVASLAEAGFDKVQIVDIIGQVFPSIGIGAGTNGGYTLPYGHDEEARELYEQFSKELQANAGDSAETKALREKIASLNAEIENNNKQLEILKPLIEKIEKEIEEKIEDAINESEEIAEDQKEAANDAVKAELKKYTNANGEMSYEKFQSNLHEKLSSLSSEGDSKMADVVRDLLDAEAQMTTLKNYVGKMGTLIKSNQNLTNDVSVTTSELETKTEELSQQSDCDAQRCDPIGFVTQDGTRYDFFIDKDGDGALSNEQEFLGAQDGWAEMAALDKDGDGKVSGDEMQGLKMVVTNADGTQEIKDATEIFDQADESIDLNSYKEVNEDMENGNTLLGTFSANVNGETIDDGYNTLDKIDWLDANYEFSDKDKGINRFEKDANVEQIEALDYSQDLQDHENKIVQLEGKLKNAWAKVGINRDELSDEIEGKISTEASEKAKAINAKIQQSAKQAEKNEEIEQDAEENNDGAIEDNTEIVVEPENLDEEIKDELEE